MTATTFALDMLKQHQGSFIRHEVVSSIQHIYLTKTITNGHHKFG
jgi:hypothetical protein